MRRSLMKLRIFALMLTLSLVVWAQGNPAPADPGSSAPETKACCHHDADAKNGEGCCHHAKADGKEACCGKDKCEMKEGKSCCGEGKDMKACMEHCEKAGNMAVDSATGKSAAKC